MLEAIAKRVGFRNVVFVYEPIAAAYHYEESATREEIVLIADIGGGTSDFTVVRIGPERRILSDRTSDILAYAGVRVGGTDFDTLLSLDAVMPALGLGTQLIKKDLPMPRALYFELATWATINFAYTYRNEREVRSLVADSREPEKTRRLLRTLQNRLGHRIAFSVEDAKIALSDRENVGVDLGFIEGGLMTDATRAGFDRMIERENRAAVSDGRHLHRGCGAGPNRYPDDLLHRWFEPRSRRSRRHLARGARSEAGNGLRPAFCCVRTDARGGAPLQMNGRAGGMLVATRHRSLCGLSAFRRRTSSSTRSAVGHTSAGYAAGRQQTGGRAKDPPAGTQVVAQGGRSGRFPVRFRPRRGGC